jgi:hypothetical protein
MSKGRKATHRPMRIEVSFDTHDDDRFLDAMARFLLEISTPQSAAKPSPADAAPMKRPPPSRTKGTKR